MNNLSNAQRAHDLATSIIAKRTNEGDEMLDIWKHYLALYTIILRDFDYRYPKGLPENFSDFPEGTLNGIPWKD
ncbi:hypothetical protein [Lactococcus petauri]|uniref:hypothetical protein n=1 Tax=Lactococcus petauri TaxID=1940789 RepID=UPI0018AC4192|nr:hypothetical protein [Lactococcus petauri]MDC0826913.1 hypothetical protein [Lactococcus petauri]